MDTELTFKIELAIEILAKIKENADYDDIINAFEVNGITKDLGINIYLFLPIVFCRKMLPKVKFPLEYYEQTDNGKLTKKSYKENDIYNIIELQANRYFSNNPESNVILKISSFSAEFKAINELLLKGKSLEDIRLTETTILI